MDFLELGMKYEKSSSKLQRAVAKCLLESEKRKADRYEEYLNKKQIDVPDDPEVSSALFCAILEQIRSEEEARLTDADRQPDQTLSGC